MGDGDEAPEGGPTRVGTASWVLYDLANTIFSFVVITRYFPVWLGDEQGLPDSVWAVALSASMAVVLLIAPLIGHVSDRARRRIPFLVVSTVACIVPTALIGLFAWQGAILLVVLANIGFQAGLIFYDSLLPVVSTQQNRGRVAAIGVGVGYAGSLIGLAAGRAVLDIGGLPLVYAAVSVLFLLFALPAFFLIREPKRQGEPIRIRDAAARFRRSFQGVWRVVRGRDVPSVGRFFLGRILYTEAANTMIAFMAVYLFFETGFEEAGIDVVLALGIVGGILLSPMWGILADRIGHRRTLSLVVLTWIFVLTIVILVPVLDLPDGVFYPLAVLLGGALGGLWATDRPLLVALVPGGRLGEFFGMYAMLGRFSAITGPLLWAFVVDVLLWGRPAAVGTLLILMVASFLVLRTVPDPVTPEGHPGARFLPWRRHDGSPVAWPADAWRRFPGTLAYAVVTCLVFIVYAVAQGRSQVPLRESTIALGPWELPLAWLAFEIPHLITNVPKTIINFGTAIWINPHPIQLGYVLVLLALFAIPFEIREGTRRTALVFWGTSIAGSVLAGALLHILLARGVEAAWAVDALGRLWAGGSAGAFGIMGALAGRARTPWLLLGLFIAWEINVEYWFLKSYTVAFHLFALAVGFAWTRWWMPPRQEFPDAEPQPR